MSANEVLLHKYELNSKDQSIQKLQVQLESKDRQLNEMLVLFSKAHQNYQRQEQTDQKFEILAEICATTRFLQSVIPSIIPERYERLEC